MTALRGDCEDTMKPTAERLVVNPEADPEKAGKFSACLESTGETIVSGSRQPVVDGARELLARG
jgi:hypothetical protein